MEGGVKYKKKKLEGGKVHTVITIFFSLISPQLLPLKKKKKSCPYDFFLCCFSDKN
jgi:hypothetical protein